MVLAVTEILGFANQGKTKPIFCRAEDDAIYVVKGQYAGKKALVSEWLAGHLGRGLGLPVPPFALMRLDEAFLKYSGKKEELQILGAETLFGSLWQANQVEIRHSNISQVDEKDRARILAFDWWIGNDDRILTELGGNPNLLWSDTDARVTVIDHNLAFEYDELGLFWQHHIFRNDKRSWLPAFRTELGNDFKAGLANLDGWWKTIPEDWLENMANLNLPGLRAKLSRCETNPAKFWGLS